MNGLKDLTGEYKKEHIVVLCFVEWIYRFIVCVGEWT